MPTAGLASIEHGSAIGPGRGPKRADAVHLRLAPDQMTGLATVASPFIVLQPVGGVHGLPVNADSLHRRHAAGQERSTPPKMESSDATQYRRIQDRLTRLTQDWMPSGRSANRDAPDRRGEVGDEAVVTKRRIVVALRAHIRLFGRDGSTR